MDETERLKARVAELEGAIRYVLTQGQDDLCWMDVYTRLGALVGVRFEPNVLPTEVFLANCARFEASLKSGLTYVPTRGPG